MTKTLHGAAPPRSGRTAAVLISLGVVLASITYLLVDTRFLYLLVYAWFGLLYGGLLQYGRFCMASAVRDLFALGVPRMAVGVLIAVILYALISAGVQRGGFSSFHPHPLGWHVLVGGLIFGFGMVFSGGCASSSLYKTGEGQLGAVLVLFSISFSQAWLVSAGHWSDALVPESWRLTAAAEDMPAELTVTTGWFDQFTAGYLWTLQGTTLAEWLGWGGSLRGLLGANALAVAVLPALLILVLLYRFNYRHLYALDHPGHGLRHGLRGLLAMLAESRNTALAGLGLGLAAGLQMLITGELRDHYGIFNFGELLQAMGYEQGLSIQYTVFDPGYWYITTQEAQWAGWLLERLGLDLRSNLFFGLEHGLPNPLLNAPGMMSIGIILGAAWLALLRGEFKWKWPSAETAVMAILGGILMGIGSRIGMGCNIGAFFATVTNGDPSGWVFLLGMTVGGYGAVRLFRRWLNWRMARQGFAL